MHVPTDFTRRQIKLCHLRELNAHQKKEMLQAQQEENAAEESKVGAADVAIDGEVEADDEEVAFGQLDA